jgi:hypothetical protein
VTPLDSRQTSENALKKRSKKWFEQCLNREFGGYMEDEMGRKVCFSAVHRTALRLARDLSDSFNANVGEDPY